ncbi:MAG: hypothetical protein AUG51_06775 [Acidobacteria bacterium 13_1_20CM_3_53_8]|nr:MAG: hypothetical protein AUG51_06775 [Acidobacteria bacterium 13_1_20CM_3_53_8]
MNFMMKFPRLARLTAVALLLCLSTGMFVTNMTQAQQQRGQDSENSRRDDEDKVSSDLRDMMNGSHAGDHVRVIVQPNGNWGSRHDDLLRNVGARVRRSFQNFNARVVEMPASAAQALASNQEISYVSLDNQMSVLGHVTTTTGTQQERTQSALLGLLSTTYDGSGVGIAFLDSGIDLTHKSFSGSPARITFSQDFTGEGRVDDPYGHGTHVAAIAAGAGSPTQGAYEGVAPGATIINLRVLNSMGLGLKSNVLKALDWILSNHSLYNIRVVNMSLGTPAVNSYKNDPLCQAVRKLVNAGLVVVAAAGNNGKNVLGQKQYGGIHSPGNEPSAITVGASNTFGTDARSDDAVTTYSSRGPTRSYSTDANGIHHYDNLMKPDLVAPGNKIISAEAANNYLVRTFPTLETNKYSTTNMKLMYLSGTSMSTPMVTGTVALMLQANSNLTPNVIKMILTYTAQPLAGYNTLEQGAGELNAAGAIDIAKLVRSNLLDTLLPPTLGSSLLTSCAPSPQSTIAGWTFPWAQGVVLNHTTANGDALITKYQLVYAEGRLLGDGVTETSSSQSINSKMMTGGVGLGSNIMTSNGSKMGGGSVFQSTNILLGDGILVTDNSMFGDGILVTDGILITDGILVTDTLVNAQTVLANGDNTACMR